MKCFHLNDSYFSDEFQNLPVTRQMNALFGTKNILTFEEAMKQRETLVCSHAWLGKSTKDASAYLDRLEALAAYRHPLVSFFRNEGGWHAGSLPIELVRCFDFVFSFNPEQVPFPSVRWYRLWPDVAWDGTSFEQKTYELCFVGRPDGRRMTRWIAAALEGCNGKMIVATTLSGPAGTIVYNACDYLGIERLHNPTREKIGEIFNQSRFLIYPTNFGPRPYDTLENAMAEAITCRCAPILNTAYCNGRFRGYPAQVFSLGNAYHTADQLLTKRLWSESLAFMDHVEALKNSCRTVKELHEILDRDYTVDPERSRRCRKVIEHIKNGRHLVEFKAHGPFYKVPMNKTFDFEEVEYV